MSTMLYTVKMEEGKVTKPLTEQQILSLVSSGRLTVDQLVRRSDSKTWQPLHVVFGLENPDEEEDAHGEEFSDSYASHSAVEQWAPDDVPARNLEQRQVARRDNSELDLRKYPAIPQFARVLRIVATIWRAIALLSMIVFGVTLIVCVTTKTYDSQLMTSFFIVLIALFGHLFCNFSSDVIRYAMSLSVRWVQVVERQHE